MPKVSAKRKILDSAQELMTSRGYSATTVDEIINLAGVSKGSFYHSFKSKEELAIAALEDYEEKGWALVSSGEYRNIEDPVARALAFVDFIEDKCQELWEHGCLLGSVSIDVARNYPNVIKKIDQLFEEFEVGLGAVFEPALRARGVTSISAKELSVHFLAVIEGSIITAKSHSRTEYLSQGIVRFKHYLTFLLGEKSA